MSDDSNVKVVYTRADADRVARWEAQARSIDRPLSWWVREVLDWAVRQQVGDPRQLDLPFDGPPTLSPLDRENAARAEFGHKILEGKAAQAFERKHPHRRHGASGKANRAPSKRRASAKKEAKPKVRK